MIKQVLKYSPEVLKTLRKAQGLSVAAMSDACGIPADTLRKWENGLRVPSIENVARLGDYFGVVFSANSPN